MDREGGVYLCRWQMVDNVYRLTLVDNSSICCEDEDIEEAKIDICMQISRWSGDGEAVLELLPPFIGASVEYVSLDYSEHVSGSEVLVPRESLFAEGGCRLCRFGIGERSDVPLAIAFRPRASVVGVRTRPGIDIFKRSIIDSVLDGNVIDCTLRDVIYKGKMSGYCEVISNHIVNTVGVVGASYPDQFLQSWRCSNCGRRSLTVVSKDYPGHTQFVAKSDLGASPPKVFLFTNGYRTSMAMRVDYLEKLRSSGKVKGITTSSVVALENNLIERSPSLPEPVAFEWVK